MMKREIEEASKSYQRIARDVLKQNSVAEGSTGRLMQAIIPSSQEFVRDTGLVRLLDIDGIGPTRERKLASIGIYEPDDLYEEFRDGHLEELLALQKGDNGFTPSVLANVIAAAPKLPYEDLGSGYEKVEMIDGTEKLVEVSDIFDMFQKQMDGEKMDPKTEKPIMDMLTASQEADLMDRFKKSNSLYGIRKVLEDAKKTFDSVGITPTPFAVKKDGKVEGRRIDEIKDYLEYFGLDGSNDDFITLEERGNYLTQKIRDRLCSTTKHPSKCVKMIGLTEVAPRGRKREIQDKILQFTKSDLRDKAENTAKDLMKRGTNRNKTGSFDKLKVDEDELAKIVVEMQDKGLLKIDSVVSGKPVGRIYPSEDVIKKDLMSSNSVLIGKTSNPRIADHLVFLHKSPKDTSKMYKDKLMAMGGKAVYEHKDISRARLNLKIPIRKDNFDDDMTSAVEILGYNIKTGLAPQGYEYKDPNVAKKFNTFNVFVRPSSEIANKYYTPTNVINDPNAYTFAFDMGSGFEHNLGLTSVMSTKDDYLTTLCPFSPNVDINRNKALSKSLAASVDSIQLNKVRGSDVYDSGDGAMTAAFKIARKYVPMYFGKIDRDTPVWSIKDLGSKLTSALNDPAFLPEKKRIKAKKEIYENLLASKKRPKKSERLTKEEKEVAALIDIEDRFGSVINTMKNAEEEADKISMEMKSESGKYNRRRRIGCTRTEQLQVDPDKKIFIKIPKNSQAGKDVSSFLKSACPKMEEKCIIDNLKFHQNITDNVGSGGYSQSIMAKKVRDANMSYLDTDDLDKVVTLTRKKVFGSGESLLGGKVETNRVLEELQYGGYTKLDLGKWSFLDRI